MYEELMEQVVAMGSWFHRILQAFRACRLQPPDTENRTSGGVGGCAGEIPRIRPVRRFVTRT
jgi:hypothetical protein